MSIGPSTVDSAGVQPFLTRRRLGRVRVPRPSITASSAFLAFIMIAAAVPQLFASGPNVINPVDAFQAPSLHHLFGTDQLGRDTFARVIYSARYSLFLGVVATVLASAIGSVWGLSAALGGRVADELAMRLADIFMSFPSILLALLVVAVLGPSDRNVTIAIAVALSPGFARIVRVQAMVVRDSGYVHAATVLGVKRRDVIVHHIAPNVLAPLVVLATMNVGTSIIAGASLSFLGLGVQPPATDWGSLLAGSQAYIQNDWALAVFPGLAVTLTVISISVIGRGLQARFEGRPT
jgi:peptide/nickel transport system permease protein